MTNAAVNAAYREHIGQIDRVLTVHGVEPTVRAIVASLLASIHLTNLYGEPVETLYECVRPNPSFPTLAKQKPHLVLRVHDLTERLRLAQQVEIALATLNLADDIRVELIRGLNRLQSGRTLSQRQKVAWQAVRAVIDMI